MDTSSSKNPSVDRANLLDNKPHRALLNDTNGIVSLIASDVRTRTIEDINKVGDSVPHTVNVLFCPTCKRPAHAEIIIDPEHFDSRSKQRKAFKYLQKALARLATIYASKNGWTLSRQTDATPKPHHHRSTRPTLYFRVTRLCRHTQPNLMHSLRRR